jgi:hypothetical protein
MAVCRRALILFALMVMECATAQAADTDARLDALFGTHRPYEQFLDHLKRSTASKDWPDIATLIAYPIHVSVMRRRFEIKSPREFLARASKIMTPKVIEAVQSQPYSSIFANAHGVMIGDGEVWFSGICGNSSCTDAPIKITAIYP